MILKKRFFQEAGLIIGLSVLIGLAVNVSLVKRFLSGNLDLRFISEKESSGVVLITLAEAENLFADGSGFFVDARPGNNFETGHIPGAGNLPLEEAGTKIKAFTASLPAGRALVIYCDGGDCLASLSLAKIFLAQGIKEPRVFLGGWAEWKKMGLPEEKGHDRQ